MCVKMFVSSRAVVLFSAVVFICTIRESLTADKECITPRNTRGTCIVARDCSIILNVLQNYQKHIGNRLLEELRKYTCDTRSAEPKVCCEKEARSCDSFANGPGICASINKCPSALQLLNQKPFLSDSVVENLRDMDCSNDDDVEAKICCPFLDKPQKIITEPEIISPPPQLPSPGECGSQPLVDKIFGGNETDISEFPWMVLLEYGPVEKPALACGGTLINSRFVLTAAHCVYGSSVDRLGKLQRIRLGEYHIDNATDCLIIFNTQDCADPIQRIDVQDIYPHTGFDFRSRQNDIALVKMKQSVSYTEFIKPICLPTFKTSLPTNFHASGWGRTETSEQSKIKLKVQLPIYDKETCGNFYSKIRQRIILTDQQFCAGGVIGQDTCTGDSGGPLMAERKESLGEIWYQYGVVSFGPQFCGRIQPGVYTSVIQYLPWIYQHVTK